MRSPRSIAMGAAGIAVVLLIVLIVFVLPGHLAHGTFKTDAARLNAENDVRTTLLQALAGAFILAGLYFTASTLKLNRSGQITERFTRAIDQLGNTESIDVRLGGIYALERIAKDSENDRETIFEVLAAFVRQHAPRRDDATQADDDATNTHERRPSEDVQAALSVLGRRISVQTDRRLSLPRTDLVGANLRYADLAFADLWGADLAGADLHGANLVFAFLTGANLTDANLTDADLRAAVLAGALGANLEGALVDP